MTFPVLTHPQPKPQKQTCAHPRRRQTTVPAQNEKRFESNSRMQIVNEGCHTTMTSPIFTEVKEGGGERGRGTQGGGNSARPRASGRGIIARVPAVVVSPAHGGPERRGVIGREASVA